MEMTVPKSQGCGVGGEGSWRRGSRELITGCTVHSRPSGAGGGGGPTAGPPPTLPAKAGLLEHRVTSEVHLTPKFTDASQSHILEVFMGEMMYLGFVF